MPFVRIPGLAGKIYVPEKQPEHEKKYNCKDCFSCQQCTDERCQLCRNIAESEKSHSLQHKDPACQCRSH